MKHLQKIVLILLSLILLTAGGLFLSKYKEQAQDEKQVKEEVKQNSLIVDGIPHFI